jgi:hypothetical protein
MHGKTTIKKYSHCVYVLLSTISVHQITRRQNRPVVTQASVVGLLPHRLFDLEFAENGVVTENLLQLSTFCIVKIIISPVVHTYSSVFLNAKRGNLAPQFGKAHSLWSMKEIKIYLRLTSRYREQWMWKRIIRVKFQVLSIFESGRVRKIKLSITISSLWAKIRNWYSNKMMQVC